MTDTFAWPARLDNEQQRAIAHPTGPALISAGPGSGKTLVLTAHARDLLARGVAPDTIIAITFTRKAAQSLRDRLDRLCGHAAMPIISGTFHSLCLRFLRRDAALLGIDTRFSVYDGDDSERALARALAEQGVTLGSGELPPLRAAIAQYKTMLLTPRRVRDRMAHGADDDPTLLAHYESYQQLLRRESALDFDDLLLLVVQLLSTNAAARARYQDQAHAVLVDELQDVSYAEARLIALLAGKHRHLVGIGDPRQSIYGFRAALPDAFATMQHWFPDAQRYQLRQNYRSSGHIVAVGQAIIGASDRYHDLAPLWTANEVGVPPRWYHYPHQDAEAAHLAHLISAHVAAGGHWRDWALLVRMHTLSRPLELALRHARIPYRLVGDIPFGARAEVKDMLAYLRLAVNGWDVEAFTRAASTPPRGLGAVTITRITEIAREHRCSLRVALDLVDDGTIPLLLRSASRHGLAAVMTTLRRMDHTLATEGVAAALDLLVADLRYYDYLTERYGRVKARARVQTVTDLIALARGLPAADTPVAAVAAFLDDVLGAWDEQSDIQEGDDVVHVLTLHASKGLEFDHVVVIGAEEAVLPSARANDDDAIEEERRLFYVGATRAACTLLFTTVTQRVLYARPMYMRPSRFVRTLSATMLRREVPALGDVKQRSIVRGRRPPRAATPASSQS